MEFAFDPPPQPYLPINGTDIGFPVRRIYCVGRNYAEHAREMGHDPRTSEPFFFQKPAGAIVTDSGHFPYPPKSDNVHFEAELVVAIGRGGSEISMEDAQEHIFGYAFGLDMTRRDLQADAKSKGRPWDTAKGFDRSAPCSPVSPAAAIGHPERARIWLKQNGKLRQDADIADMIWKVPGIVSYLSGYFELFPGDLIMTGTPAGVGPVDPGDRLDGGVEGVGSLTTIVV